MRSTSAPRLLLLTLLAAVLVAGAVAALAATDPGDGYWPQWRGPTGNGVALEGDPPIEWSETKNIRWKKAIPGLGTSTPVVWGDRLFLTTAVDSGKPGPRPAPEPEPEAEGRRRRPRGAAPANLFQFTVMALDRSSGEVLWQQVAREEQPHEGRHPTGTYASNSPVTDGERLYVFFGSRGLYAYDLDGKLLWEKDLGDMEVRLGFGEGASPALSGDRLVVNWDHEGDSFIAALDKRSGEELWRTAREEMTSWTTPLIVPHGDGAQVVVSATRKVRSYDLESGALIWETTGMTLNAIPSPVYQDGVVYLASGFRGNSLMAVRIDGAKGDIAGTENVLWTFDRDTPYVPSPLLYRDRLYFLKSNNGLLSVMNARTGEVIYGPERIDAVSNIYASPVAAAGRVYLVGRDGGGLVLKDGEQLEILAENQLDDGFDASPVVVGDELYLRGRESLYCIAAE